MKNKFKTLTDSDKNWMITIYNEKELLWDERMNIICDKFKVSERTVRRWLVDIGCKEKTEIISEQYDIAKQRKHDKEQKRFIITWAQNNTPVHKQFFENIKTYANFINADIHVIAGRYKNPTSVFTDRKEDFWADVIAPYLDANRHKIHPKLNILADVKMQPTAVEPLSGMTAMSGDDSCIFGHPKVHFEPTPALCDAIPKMMWTTGACTVKNYTDSKAGKKGEFHHTFGFIVVEIDNNEIFHVRQVTASSDGSFYDLTNFVFEQKVHKNNVIEATILGDIHLGSQDKEVMRVTKSLLNILKPKYTILHDLFDGHSISHHHINNPIKMFQKEKENKNSLKQEINNMIDWLYEWQKYNLVVVRSNHDDFVDRWIINADWKKNIKNSLEYMEYAKLLLNDEAPKGIIPYIIDKHFKNIITLNRDESFKVKGWELGSHGDLGQNGTKGSLLQFKKLNIKTVTAHSHSPARKDGALQVGTSTERRLDYNQGPSSWLNSHVLIYPNGKAQHINIIKGRYTTFFD